MNTLVKNDHPFTYESGKIDLKLGDYVTIPFGKAKSTGYNIVWILKNLISELINQLV